MPAPPESAGRDVYIWWGGRVDRHTHHDDFTDLDAFVQPHNLSWLRIEEVDQLCLPYGTVPCVIRVMLSILATI